MQPKKTVFVVGAGASQEVDLPTSAELKTAIARYLDIRFDRIQQSSGDHIIAEALRITSDINQCLPACHKIRDALPQAMSIDNFIDAHQENEKVKLCGKLAIVRSILEAERISRLYVKPYHVDRELNFNILEDTWYNVLWQRITESCQVEGLKDRFSSIALIIFNYDRCIEHFLFHAMQNYYDLSAEDAAAIVNSMKIFHPYGLVGSLPWATGSADMAFGGEPSAQQLVKLAEKIKTFTEGTNPEASDIMEIRRHVATADSLVFLGFAYHQQNLKLLAQPDDRRNNERNTINCYGTTVGISKADLDVISSEILKLCNASLAPNEDKNLTCQQLFNTYRRTLSFV